MSPISTTWQEFTTRSARPSRQPSRPGPRAACSACRLHLEGRRPLHARLHAAGDELLAEVRALGLGEGVAWVEKIAIATAPLADAAATEGVEDLRRILGTLTEGDLEDLCRRAKIMMNRDKNIHEWPVNWGHFGLYVKSVCFRGGFGP